MTSVIVERDSRTKVRGSQGRTPRAPSCYLRKENRSLDPPHPAAMRTALRGANVEDGLNDRGLRYRRSGNRRSRLRCSRARRQLFHLTRMEEVVSECGPVVIRDGTVPNHGECQVTQTDTTGVV